MNNQPQYPPPPQQSTARPQAQKPILVQAIDGISIILAIVTSLFVSPFLLKYTQGFFVNFMNAAIGNFGELWALAWGMICYLGVGATALAFINVKITTVITKSTVRSLK